MSPLVTIVTPSYNQGKYIRETIKSVLNQDYPNIEYIIIDGGSTDGTISILDSYQKNGKIKYISEKDNGQSDAINKGFKMAHGQYVAWLNSDDTYEPGAISKMVHAIEQNPRIGLVYGDGYIINEEGKKVKKFEYTQKFDFWKLVNFWDYIMQPATLFRRDILEKIGYLNVRLNYCMDWDLWIRLASVSEVIYLNELLACSREYGETKTSTGGEKRLIEITDLLKKYSGKELPLGIISYKASTAYTEHLKCWWSVRKYYAWRLLLTHKKLFRSMPEIYDDGWIGKKLCLTVPMYVEKVHMIFFFPDGIHKKQRINIYLDDRLYKSVMVTGKKHEIKIFKEVGKLSEIRIECARTFRQKNDKRELGIKATIRFY